MLVPIDSPFNLKTTLPPCAYAPVLSLTTASILTFDPSIPVKFLSVVVEELFVILRVPFAVDDEYLLVAPNTTLVVYVPAEYPGNL